MDWNRYKIRCSSLFVLFVEPQSKEAKIRGELSETAKKHLYKVYIKEKWDRWEGISAKQLEKGKLVEDQIISILSILDDALYVKNTERKENDWIQGEPDIVGENHIDDCKASWDHESFAPHIMEPIGKDNFYQMQGYLWLFNKPTGKISRALVSCPEFILKKELQKLLYSMNVASEEAEEYKIAAADLIRNLVFEDIPVDERIIRKEVIYDQSIIDQIPAKVTVARKFLAEIEEKHKSFSFLKE